MNKNDIYGQDSDHFRDLNSYKFNQNYMIIMGINLIFL